MRGRISERGIWVFGFFLALDQIGVDGAWLAKRDITFDYSIACMVWRGVCHERREIHTFIHTHIHTYALVALHMKAG